MKNHALFVIFEKMAKFKTVVCSNYRWRFKVLYVLTNVSIEAKCVDRDQTAPTGVYTVCRKRFLNLSEDVKSRQLLL